MKNVLANLIRRNMIGACMSMLFCNQAFANEPQQTGTTSALLTQKNIRLEKRNDMDTIKINLQDLKKDSWSEVELENAELVVDFVQHLMNNHDFDYVSQKYSSSNYIQHSKGIADGMAELIEYVKDFSKRFPEYTYDVKHIHVDGNIVTFHSHATLKTKHRGNDKKGFNIIDTWRVENGEILEHWDSIQPIDGLMRFYIWLTGGKTRNTNGIF
jgi:predicted SnoaL-like aldol condensation-catalyzing enzyme